MLGVRRLIRQARQRVLSSKAGQRAANASSRAIVRTLKPNDDTLAAVVRALRSPSEDEARWVSAIEPIRRRLEASEETLRFPVYDRAWWERAIAASRDPQPPVLHDDHIARSLGEITRVTSKPPDWGRFLYRVVRELRPERCLELGTSVGMSGSYIAAGLTSNDRGRLVTIEGEEPSATVARAVFEQIGVAPRVDVRIGRFSDQLASALDELGGADLVFIDGHHQYEPTMAYFATILEAASPGGLLAFDDVTYRLGDMETAWRDIRANPRVTGSLTVGSVGFAVVDGRRTDHRRVRRLTVTAG
jgi:predicted O-methyltransferase YrrM